MNVGALGPRIPVAFATALRQAGIDVSTRAVADFADALDVIDVGRREQVRWAAHASFVTRPEQRGRFDAVFSAFFGGAARLEEVVPPPQPRVSLAVDDAGCPDDAADIESTEDPAGDVLRFSSREVLSNKDFARCDDTELAELHRLISKLRVDPPTRHSRRRRLASVDRGRFDLAATAKAGLATSGELIRIERTTTTTRARRLVLLLDVSGSMEAYSRSLLRFAHAASVGRGQVEVFAMATRLTRLTRELRSHDPDAALAEAAREMVDHGGGTRLGETLQEFNDAWGVRGLARGATVVICSDGWDRGDPTRLGTQMERLSRVTHRLVWVNPLKASENYEPLARGMAAALPHVDEFVEGHSFAALEHLAQVVAA